MKRILGRAIANYTAIAVIAGVIVLPFVWRKFRDENRTEKG